MRGDTTVACKYIQILWLNKIFCIFFCISRADESTRRWNFLAFRGRIRPNFRGTTWKFGMEFGRFYELACNDFACGNFMQISNLNS